MRETMSYYVIEEGVNCFLLGFGGAKTREKKKWCYCGRDKNRETSRHHIPAKEEEFVFLSFVLSLGTNHYCVMVRFGYIGVLGLSDYLYYIFVLHLS
jgi:hypothetical protein